MTMSATSRAVPEPSETPLSDRIAAGYAALPISGGSTDHTHSTYWTTSLNRPTGFVPVDLGGPTPEHLAHGLLLALAAVPVGVIVAFTTARSGSVTVLAAATLALGAAVLYRLGARSVSRRGALAVSVVVLVGVLLEVVAVAASETSALTGGRASGPLGFGQAVLHRLADPSQTSRFVGATAILLFVGLAVTAGALVWLSSDGTDDGDDVDEGEDDATSDTPQDVGGAVDQFRDGDPDETDQTHQSDQTDQKAGPHATDD